tara:strand:- start:138398 stop:141655 length:3258 start_codon:yes stop_codon:yes gene_type:complete
MGGEITWECQGNGDYVFELFFYRDCNGFEVSTTFEELRVWGHPTVSTIQVDYVDRVDISPSCTPAGGATQFDCGTGVGGGNGVGAVEKIIYRSNPITLAGTPPSDGWHFTYESFSRSGNLTNISTPTNFGITISATMYEVPGSTGGCVDNSPKFLQEPYVVSCAGEPYSYNPHAVDQDLDSLTFDWGVPLDYFPSGSFNPPTNPAPVPFEPGFSFDNPTPDASFNASNSPATLDPNTGAMEFTSFTQGNFATKVVVDSYRNGVKIATVEREVQLIVSNCTGSNTTPSVAPPFDNNTSFDTTIFAGDLVNFSINSTDIETLQDGSAQTNTISSTGLMYGANFVDPNSGCPTTPCATLNNAPSATGVSGSSLGVEWQTSCDHLIGADGNAQNEVPYIFVFKIQDDYCPIPTVRYVTVTITVKNQDVLTAPTIECITTDQNDDVLISWSQVNDPNGVFDSYEVSSLNSGSLGIINNINTTTFTVPGGGNVEDQYFVSVNSGCNGNTAQNSDTISNIFLTLNNPGNGEAVLDWNNPSSAQLSSYNDYYHIYREYPIGTWTLIDSVPYGTTNYNDTITICDAFLNYRIVLPTDQCDFESNIEGDDFEDMIVPDIPNISSVNIDTNTNDVTIEWDENGQPDTYGYVVYQTDGNGNLVEIDTVWGAGNTTFTHSTPTGDGPIQYSIAAFDSCFTSNVPPTYQTSAKAPPHTTNFLNAELNICERSIDLNWTGYEGFSGIQNYEVYTNVNNLGWSVDGSTQATAYQIPISLGDEVLIAIKTNHDDGITYSFSNVDTVSFVDAGGPTHSYLSVATVENEEAVIKHRLALDGGASEVRLERYEPSINAFEEIDVQPVISDEIVFVDEEAEVTRRSYTYRTEVIDTCGQSFGFSNIGKTIYLSVITDQESEAHVLTWTHYEEFVGNLQAYRVYRAIDGNYDPTPIATLPANRRTYTDTVALYGDFDDGEICYFVTAIEGSNSLGLEEVSFSNEACGVIEPTIYVPNAFTVGGKNPVFKPETRQHKIEDYSFEIYDRYGRTIFETVDPNEGWDGRLEPTSRIAREGVYIYRLSLRTGNGIEILKHGHVTLLDYRGVE